MNYPMLYWFVLRELVGFAKFLLVAALVIGFLWLLRSIRNSAPQGPACTRRLAWFFGLFVLPLAGLLISNEIMERRQIAKSQACVKAASPLRWLRRTYQARLTDLPDQLRTESL